MALSVRPEKIAISADLDAEPESVNRLTGVVETIVFLGESTTYFVRASDREFRVKRFHDADHRIIPEGTSVLLSWHPDDTSIFIQ